MSSSNTENKDQISSLIKTGQLLAGVFTSRLSPIGAAVTGGVNVSKFLFYTTLGRASILIVLLLCTFTYFKAHFTALEKHKWEVDVATKQVEIVSKVAAVNAETKKSQQLAKQESGWWDKIFAVVSDGIVKVQQPHPIESETIDLINETRGPSTVGTSISAKK